MHDRTRRLLCRAGFLAICVLPTVGVFAWTGSRRTAGHSSACAAELSQALGVRVTLGGVSYPHPRITRYDGMELADPETAAPLGRVRSLEVGDGNGATVLVAAQPELEALQLGRLWTLIEPRWLQAIDSPASIRLAAAEATLHWPDGSQTLTEVLGQFDAGPAAGERSATISFRLAGLDLPEPVRIKWARGLSGSQPTTRLELHTGTAAVPCRLISLPLGIANHLGPRAKFRGSVWAEQTPDGWQGELSGQFSDVDLRTLVSEQFPHRLDGTAEITIQKARFRQGRLEEAAGSLSAGPGVVSRSLLNAAMENLRLGPGSLPLSNNFSNAPVSYEQFAVAFVIDASGLTLRGQCDAAPGAIVCGRDGVLASEAAGPSGPVVALVRTLVPKSEVQVPATRESDWLIGRLPVPQVMPPSIAPQWQR